MIAVEAKQDIHHIPTASVLVVDSDEDAQANEITTLQNVHPLGVKPSGNALTSDQDLSLSMGLFGRIPDSLVLLLLEFLDQPSLVNLGSTCRGLFAYTAYDQLWRDLATREGADDLLWRGSWRASRRHLNHRLPKIACEHLYSDALYRPFQCENLDFHLYIANIPSEIPRLGDLSADEFAAQWSGRPFILTNPVKQWRVYSEWSEETLLAKYAQTVFRAEAVDWPFENYIHYMRKTSDESPLYLFDCNFVEKMRLKIGASHDYEPPQCFGDDLFNLLGEQRPDHRWLIIGPERSGSTFHKDPNATSAWNAVIRGSKYWLMFPNSVTPPGVFVSDDQSEVTSPLSIAEWLLTFHEEARQTPGCLEGICHEGEIVHVPSGWWHLVVNLEPAIAITQNFVPKAHLRAAAHFLKHKPDQVSGFKGDVSDPYALFIERLMTVHPDLYDELEESSRTKRKWEEVVANEDDDGTNRGGFSFAFEDDLEEED